MAAVFQMLLRGVGFMGVGKRVCKRRAAFAAPESARNSPSPSTRALSDFLPLSACGPRGGARRWPRPEGPASSPGRIPVSSSAMEKQLPLQSFLALAAIGWADGSLQRIEPDGLLLAAKGAGLTDDELGQGERASKEQLALYGVELSVLSRWEQVLTYALASWFAALDGVTSTSEHETMVRIGDLLQLDEPLRIRAAAAANDIAC